MHLFSFALVLVSLLSVAFSCHCPAGQVCHCSPCWPTCKSHDKVNGVGIGRSKKKINIGELSVEKIISGVLDEACVSSGNEGLCETDAKTIKTFFANGDSGKVTVMPAGTYDIAMKNDLIKALQAAVKKLSTTKHACEACPDEGGIPSCIHGNTDCSSESELKLTCHRVLR